MLLFQYQQINENDDDTSVGLFHECYVKMQNSLVAYCKKKSRELHRVKSEEVNRQTSKKIGKNNDLMERQQHKLLDSFKDAYGMLCHTWERLRCTGQILKHSLGSRMTLDAGWMRW